MNVNDLYISQQGLRNIKEIEQMVEYCKAGHVFNLVNINAYLISKTNKKKFDSLIEISRFEDGRLMIHNGHHRCLAIYLGRKSKELYSSEYVIKDWKYDDYRFCSLPEWVTPFDPILEIRVSNLKDWKDFIYNYYKLNGLKKTESYIYKHRVRYCMSRAKADFIKDILYV